MKALFFLSMILPSAGLFAQTTTEQAGIQSKPALAEHFKNFSWVYIAAFVLLLAVFVAGYFFGWDKKLFKHKQHDDKPQLFI